MRSQRATSLADQVAELARLVLSFSPPGLQGEGGERLGAARDAGQGVRDLVGHAGHELAQDRRAGPWR